MEMNGELRYSLNYVMTLGWLASLIVYIIEYLGGLRRKYAVTPKIAWSISFIPPMFASMSAAVSAARHCERVTGSSTSEPCTRKVSHVSSRPEVFAGGRVESSDLALFLVFPARIFAALARKAFVFFDTRVMHALRKRAHTCKRLRRAQSARPPGH